MSDEQRALYKPYHLDKLTQTPMYSRRGIIFTDVRVEPGRYEYQIRTTSGLVVKNWITVHEIKHMCGIERDTPHKGIPMERHILEKKKRLDEYTHERFPDFWDYVNSHKASWEK